MPFDAETYSTAAVAPTPRYFDDVAELCPEWTALNPDRALALLFVAPRDCAAVDVLVSL